MLNEKQAAFLWVCLFVIALPGGSDDEMKEIVWTLRVMAFSAVGSVLCLHAKSQDTFPEIIWYDLLQ